MAFRKKAGVILAHRPDILIIQECEHPSRLLFPPGTPTPTDTLWFGKNQHKGMGIFSYGAYRFTVLKNHNRKLKMIVPIAVTGGEFDFTLFAVWANNPTDKDGQYVEQVWKAVHHYEEVLATSASILAGDFNSNTIWDRKRRAGNHSNVVKFLSEKGILSTYHEYHKQAQGAEMHPTLYLYRHKDKPYHLDYCFASDHIAKKIKCVEVGDYEAWCKYSDHVPLMITVGDA
jgi:exodeoxyribonuclease III